MATRSGRSRGRILLLLALTAVWIAVVVAVGWRAAAPPQRVEPVGAAEPPGEPGRPASGALAPAPPASNAPWPAPSAR